MFGEFFLDLISVAGVANHKVDGWLCLTQKMLQLIYSVGSVCSTISIYSLSFKIYIILINLDKQILLGIQINIVSRYIAKIMSLDLPELSNLNGGSSHFPSITIDFSHLCQYLTRIVCRELIHSDSQQPATCISRSTYCPQHC